jgi:hypothetical protein
MCWIAGGNSGSLVVLYTAFDLVSFCARALAIAGKLNWLFLLFSLLWRPIYLYNYRNHKSDGNASRRFWLFCVRGAFLGRTCFSFFFFNSDACTCLMVRKLAVASILFLCQASCSSASFICFCKVECRALCSFVHCIVHCSLFRHSVGRWPIYFHFVATTLEQERRGTLNPVGTWTREMRYSQSSLCRSFSSFFSHFVIHFSTAWFDWFVLCHCLFL